MPFKSIAKVGRSKRDVLKAIPGVQTRKEVKDIVLEVIKDRRTVRKFMDREIPDSILLKILESARYAPSAGNQQPWEFIIIKRAQVKKLMVEACLNQDWLADAPVIIIVGINTRLSSAKFGERGEKLYGVQGTAAAIENMLIAAESLGVSSAWVGAFSEKAVGIITGCPDYVRPCAVVTMGYADEKPEMPPRQELKEFIHFERFGETYLTKRLYKEEEIY